MKHLMLGIVLSVALFGSLLGRVKEFRISSPGGDVIGLRPITVQLSL